MWVLDIQSALEEIRSLDLSDSGSLRRYLKNNPDRILRLGGQIHVLDVNQTALEIFEAEDKETLVSEIPRLMTRQAYETLAGVLEIFQNGVSLYRTYTEGKTLTGRRIHLEVEVHRIDPDSGRVVVGLRDTTVEEKHRATDRAIQFHFQLLQKTNALAAEETPLALIIQTVCDELKEFHDLTWVDVVLKEVTTGADPQLRLAYLNLKSRLLTSIETLVGLRIRDIRWPIRPGSIVERILASREPMILNGRDEMTELLQQLVPANRKALRFMAPKVVTLLNIQNYSLFPMWLDDRSIGALGLAGGMTFPPRVQKSLLTVADKLSALINLAQSREAVSEANSRSRIVLNTVPDLFFHQRRDGTFLDCIADNSDLLIHPIEEIIGKKLSDLGMPTEIAAVGMKNLLLALDTQEIRTFDYELDTPRLGTRHFEARIVPINADEALNIIRDVTDKHQQQQRILHLEKQFQAIFDQSPILMVLTGINSRRIRAVNRRVLELTGLKKEELVGQLPPETGVIDHRTYDLLYEKMAGKSVLEQSPIELKARDGTIRHGILEAYTISVDGVRSVLSAIVDVTEKHRAQDQVRRDLEEKNVLLREIHHRVKNNLQIVISLLRLQMLKMEEGPSRRMLQESINRIFSMALVHEQIYREDNLSRIPFPDYLEELIEHITSSAPGRIQTHVETRVTELTLNLEQAIPLALIVNEAVTNALKHAFPGQQTGEIIIDLAREQMGYCLAVRDNGIGWQGDDSESARGSLGASLMNVLASQLDSTLEVEELHPGTRISVRFQPDSEPG